MLGSSSVKRLLTSVIAAAILLAGLQIPVAEPARGAEPAVSFGYITMPDGVRLRYTIARPEPTGRFPVLLSYDGYTSGSGAHTFADGQRFLDEGYAVLGVNIRGTACSSGTWDPFERRWATDGARVVEWAAGQSWSDGRVGMFGYSWPGIMQLFVAGQRPPHLRAIAPGHVTADLYRDVAYPGGIQNAVFPNAWGQYVTSTWTGAQQQAVQEGDAECLANSALNIAMAGPNRLGAEFAQHPYDDSWVQERSALSTVDRIRVPTLALQAWQDEQVGSRNGHYFERLDPSRTWVVSTNGPHHMWDSPAFLELLVRFFDRYLGEVDNGFDTTDRAVVWHESHTDTWEPRWVTSYPRWPVARTPLSLYLRSGGELALTPPAGAEPADQYRYPGAGSETVPVDERTSSWTGPSSSGTNLAYTTAPLTADATFFGEGSLDLWISSSATDTDLQVTVSEVRPDGNEVYVQRGWLRASHRALDLARSSTLRPFHPHTRATQQPLRSGEAALARVEIPPFGHTFRAGSSIRLWIETPSQTGFWGFAVARSVATNSVYHDAARPSALVLGHLPGETAGAPLPACGTVAFQPCRANERPVPTGTTTPPGA